jgi:hypothetical protein
MAKVKLNLSPAPETFTHTVTLVLQNGDEAELVIEYIYREKLEYGKWVDAQLQKTKDKKTAAIAKQEKQAKKTASDDETESTEKTVLELMSEAMEEDAKGLLEIAKSWDLQEDFTQENIIKFENKYPGAIQAIATAYPAALYAIRLKH